MKPSSILLSLLVLSLSLVASAAEPDLGGVAERHEMIPMRDGKRLSAWLYFPQGKGPWPAVFEQRYADLRGVGTRQAAAKLAAEGFVVAMVNFRGTYESEGTWVGYRALAWGELQDGFDSCEWLAAQPWCTGNIGTFGSSQGGYAQNFLAVTQPPHLKCQYMVDTGLSLFQEGYRIGGATKPERFKKMDAVCRNPADNRRLMEEWFRHPNYDDYWRAEDCSLHFDRMNVPCFTIGSWFDFMNQGSIASFQGRQHHGGPNSRGKQQLAIGPWLHGRLNKGNRVGELTFPENAVWPEQEHMVRWFNHWLKGEDNGVERDPTVRYYAMGALGEPAAPGNVWRSADDFPPAAAATSYYLQSAGKLTNAAPDRQGGATSYLSDPLHPMEIPGVGFPGARDARPFEQQSEVRTFTSAPLEEPVEWTGRVKAELFVSSTARDTDFIVRVSDVYPDGRSMLLIDYPLRARYREGFEREVLLEPGKVAKLAFDVGWLSQIFNRGHRIRVTVASAGAPFYEPNPQTGKPLTIEFPSDAVAATNTVHHRQGEASRIIAPVATAAAAATKGPAEFEAALGFLKVPAGVELGACSAVAVNSRGEIHLFHRGPQPILCFDAQGNFLRSWGDDVIDTAHGLRIDRDDNVWATDIGNHRVFKFDPRGKVRLALGTGKPGAGSDTFNKPTDVAFGPQGEFYVTDGYGNTRVQKFSPHGGLIASWGQPGKGPGQFNLPHSIVIDRRGRILVGDRENNRIQIFDEMGSFQSEWTGFAPYGLALDKEGQLFVADGRANQVLQLDAEGRVVQRWGGKGKAVGEFDLPHMLSFDAAGNLHVAEVGGKRVQMLKRK